MGEKVYKPIVKGGDHLIRSKNNPDHVRGLTRDENNQNPDIIEWEEFDLEDLQSGDYEPRPYEERHVQLTPEQEEFAQQVGEVLGAAIVAGGILLFRKVISPWWKNTAWPWVQEKGCSIKDMVNGRKKQKTTKAIKAETTKEALIDSQLSGVSSQIDKEFERLYFDMDEDEVKPHIMRLVYHMLGMANEIRIISNARIRNQWELPGYRKVPLGRRKFGFAFRCRNRQCDFSTEDLPLFVVDESIYEETPTLLLGTVDKFAMLPFRPNAQKIFGYENGVKKTSPDLIKWRLPSSGDIQKRCCPCIDTHKLPLDLPVRLTHGHQKIHSLSDLLKVRRSESILMQMLQNTAVSVFQRRRYGRLKEIG